MGNSIWVVFDDVITQYMASGEGYGGRKIMPPGFWVLRTMRKPKKQKNQFAQPNRTGIHKDPHYTRTIRSYNIVFDEMLTER